MENAELFSSAPPEIQALILDTSSAVPSINRHTFEKCIPLGLSKSQVKSMGCEQYFASVYLTADSIAKRIGSPMADTGTDFHKYRAEYINHLISANEFSDDKWATEWLRQNAVSDDARRLIESDIHRFSVDPNNVLGTELYLSVDTGFLPLEVIFDFKPGAETTNAEVYANSTLDLIQLVEKDVAAVTDYKSGWSSSNVSEYEPAHQCALVFACFPYVQRILFQWEFIRSGQTRKMEYTRKDLEWMKRAIQAADNTKREIAARFFAGDKLTVNPFAGLCAFCPAPCPLVEAVERHEVSIPPIRTLADAQEIARKLFVAKILVKNLGSALKPFLDSNGPIDVGSGVTAGVSQKIRNVYSLPALLRLLLPDLFERLDIDGIEFPASAPQWDIPLDKLTVSASKLNSYAKAKKRRGLPEALESIAVKTVQSCLTIGEEEEEIPD